MQEHIHLIQICIGSFVLVIFLVWLSLVNVLLARISMLVFGSVAIVFAGLSAYYLVHAASNGFVISVLLCSAFSNLILAVRKFKVKQHG